MLRKNLENSPSYDIFFYKFWKKAGVYYTLSISRAPLDLPLYKSPVIERLMVRGSQVAINHVFHDMEIRTLVMELRRRAIKRWVPCDDMDRRLKVPHLAKVKCGFRTTPEECLYDSDLNGLQYRASSYNSIQYEVEKTCRSYSTKSFQNH